MTMINTMIKLAVAILVLVDCSLSGTDDLEFTSAKLGTDCQEEEGHTHCYVKQRDKTTLDVIITIKRDVTEAVFGAHFNPNLDDNALVKSGRACVNKKEIVLDPWVCWSGTLRAADSPYTLTKEVTIPKEIEKGQHKLYIWEREIQSKLYPDKTFYENNRHPLRVKEMVVHVGEDKPNHPITNI